MASAPTTAPFDPALLRGISVYQDVVLDGQVAHRGQRDCAGRWALIEPHLPHSGAVFDVGSNFGWFGLQVCNRSPDSVVASVEADLRSAAVQRAVLQSHAHSRIALLTRRATASMLEDYAHGGQRFAAAFCFSVLHWMADHEEFLQQLADMTDRIFVEQPDLAEEGAGDEAIRREIGQIGDYLARMFPDRNIRKLGSVASHRDADLPREVWMVEGAAPQGAAIDTAFGGIELNALLRQSPAWPPRSWWLAQLAAFPPETLGCWKLSSTGLVCQREPSDSTTAPYTTAAALRRRLNRLPEERLLSAGGMAYRRARAAAGAVLRGLGLR